MWKRKLMSLALAIGTGLLFSGGCSLDSWWPWAIGGAGALALLGLGT